MADASISPRRDEQNIGLKLKVERVEDIALTELWPLLEQHREELTTNKELMVLAPDWGKYAAMERLGMLFVLIAREHGQIVGYSANFIMQHLHYVDVRYAQNDLLFLVQSHRRGRLGLRLMRETEREAKARGAQMMLWHAKPETTLDVMLSRMKYRVQDVTYSREI